MPRIANTAHGWRDWPGEVLSLGSLAIEALLLEASCTPAPGLVDRVNSGAHRDMDYLTFQKSIAALSGPMFQLTAAGWDYGGKIRGLLPVLREIGLAGEARMYRATRNVNTHKGALFALGLVTAAAAYQARRGREISFETVSASLRELCRGLVARELKGLKRRPGKALTAGERLYLQDGITGIRGELEQGLPSVREAGLPFYEKALAHGLDVNDALIHALLALMTKVEDTTILHRHNRQALEYVQALAGQTLDLGGMLTPEGRILAQEMDDVFISRNISPGGSADLLAVTYFIHEAKGNDFFINFKT